MVGRTISHYRIVAQLGSGGMGVVYRAEDLRLGRGVALKFVSEDLAHDPAVVHRLRSEARAASALNHPNICTIYDIGEADGHPFIVMELMTGRTLRDHLANGPLKVHQIVSIGIEIADALDAAHAGGIVHRDIKPGNIFVTDRGHVKILDFGLAKLTRLTSSGTTDEAQTAAGVTLGTTAYMSPEQATGEDLDGRTDLFSLGVVLYECATGRHPFPGKTSAAVLAGILNRAPVAPIALNPDLPLRLQDVINNCLEKDRELRYQSAADLRADLRRVKRDLESGHSRAVDVVPHGSSRGATHPSPARDAGVRLGDRAWAGEPSIARRAARWGAWALVGIALLAASATAGWYALSRRTPQPTRVQATRDAAPAAHTAQAGQDQAGQALETGQLSQAGQAVPSKEVGIGDRLRDARLNLEAHNYSAALTYASEVLSLEPRHDEALRIREQARAMLARFDAAITDARQRLASGDIAGASRALDTARRIDAAAPSVSEISTRLSDEVRKQLLAARSRDRTPPPAPTGPDTSSGTARERTTAADDRPGAANDPARMPGEEPRSKTAAAPVPPPPAPRPASAPADTPSTPPPPQSSSPPQQAPAAQSPPAVPASPVSAIEPLTPAPKSNVARAPAPDKRDSSAPATSTAEQEDGAIRRVVATYARAIEGKDMALFRSIKPNLSREEERRLRSGFDAVTSQRVSLAIESIDRRGDEASVMVRRRDTIEVGGRQQTTSGQQVMRLARTSAGWVIVEIR